MTAITLRKVQNRRERRQFLLFPWKVYAGDSLWVPPLIPEQMKVIDPERGAFFKRGDAEFFTAWRGREIVGRVCVAEDKFTNQSRGHQDCVIGFFDFLDDEPVFDTLLAHAVSWARARDLDTLLGPFHLDYEEAYGLLVQGRERPPTLMCGHTPEYYLRHYQRAGFTPARAANLAFVADLNDSPELARLSRLADYLREKGRIGIRPVDFDYFQDEVDCLHRLLEESLKWAEDRIPWHRDQLEAMVEPFKQIADPDLILFAEVDGKTVGWLPGIPNLNEAFIKINGLRYPWNYQPLLSRLRKQPRSLAVKSFLVLPEYQKTGVAVLLMDELVKRARAKGYEWVDLSITSEDNPDTPELAAKVGAVEYKRWQVYRKPI